MSPNRLDPTAITLTSPRQTPKDEFGDVLSNAMGGVVKLGGAVLNAATGAPVVSAAVSSVSALGSLHAQRATSGVVAVGGAGLTSTGGGIVPMSSSGSAATVRTVATSSTGGGVEPANMTDYLGQMRAEADRSLLMQMQMQQESREYNTLTNILKLRHDSAKAAINNVR
ncbi:MAG: hypothetical protein K1X89_00545 [Myxococcaceae bacterium]|nr:hypothetical protein [Myxococcaceae bacterium]